MTRHQIQILSVQLPKTQHLAGLEAELMRQQIGLLRQLVGARGQIIRLVEQRSKAVGDADVAGEPMQPTRLLLPTARLLSMVEIPP